MSLKIEISDDEGCEKSFRKRCMIRSKDGKWSEQEVEVARKKTCYDVAVGPDESNLEEGIFFTDVQKIHDFVIGLGYKKSIVDLHLHSELSRLNEYEAIYSRNDKNTENNYTLKIIMKQEIKK